MLKCAVCGFLFAGIDDHKVLEANLKFGEQLDANYIRDQTQIDELWFQRTAKKITGKKEPGKILDVGCGNGLLLRQFIDLGWTAHGLDISPWTKKYAKKYGYELHITELEKSDLPDSHFDLVLSTSNLEHIAQPIPHIQEMLRVLKPGGTLFISGVLNHKKKIASINPVDRPPWHSNFFTAKTLRALFSQPGISQRVESIKVITYGIPFAHIFYRFASGTVQKIKGSLKFTSIATDKIEDGNSQLEFKKQPRSVVKETVGKAIVEMYYLIGRPFHLGDKLEAVVIKQ